MLLLVAAPMHQSQAYHRFADDRAWLGVPNFLNVATNLPFLFVGLIGVRWLRARPAEPARWPWLAFFIGVALVSVGSSYYHWSPTDETLVWDRLPMTVGFMGLFVALIAEFVDTRVIPVLLPLMLIIGALSVALWVWTDDLRVYAWVQGMPLVALPLIMALFKAKYTKGWYLLVALGFYLAAKVVESTDHAIWDHCDGHLSGHPVKHLLAAGATWWIYKMLAERAPRVARRG